MGLIYTKNWFSLAGIEHILPMGTINRLDMLEIGSFEGQSTIWFLQNLLQHPESFITCVDPWLNYSQDTNSINSYNQNITEWNFKNDNIKSNFLNNIQFYNLSSKINILQGLSSEILPLLAIQKKRYDIIYIDGNHTAPFVLTDAILCWNLLKLNSIMIFDDYGWGLEQSETLRPKLAIDSFVNCFKDYIDVVINDYKYVIKRIK